MVLTTKNRLHISVNDLKKRGLLKKGKSKVLRCYHSIGERAKEYAIRIYTVISEKESYVAYSSINDTSEGAEGGARRRGIKLDKTRCNYGGYRYRLVCPHSKRRCSKLYVHSNGGFYDRKVLKLCYFSQTSEGKKAKIKEDRRKAFSHLTG